MTEDTNEQQEYAHLLGLGDVDVSRPKTDLETHDNGRQKCTACDRTIPAEKQRVSFSFRNAYGTSSNNRICEDCLLAYAVQILSRR